MMNRFKMIKSNGARRIGVLLSGLSLLVVLFMASDALAGSHFRPSSEFLPAVEGEPSVDFCAQWNPEFAHRGYRCCSNSVSRNVASGKRRRRANSCAPNRINWTFCNEMTPAQREYVRGVKEGRIDPLESIDNARGSRGQQAFCSVSNGFLVEGRPIIASPNNRIEIRNEARCTNFATDPLAGAMEWVGREIKREFHEPEFERVRLIMGDASAPRGGCISGRFGRRAHKSHTNGVDIDVTFFNPRAGHPPEERFTSTFYVASNWWFLKKLFRNPYACVKVVFLDRRKIRMLERYAKDDPEWAKLRPFLRHTKGHGDHYHIRVGDGPGVPGCMGDPNLEELEDDVEETENGSVDGSGLATASSQSRAIASIVEDLEAGSEAAKGVANAESVTGAIPPTGALGSVPPSASNLRLAQATLPPHKMEPAISMKYQERPRRRAKPKARTARAKVKVKSKR